MAQTVAEADAIVASRYDLQDAQRLAADLAAAPAKDQQRLVDEQARLSAVQADVRAAEAAVTKARAAIVDARQSGESDADALAAHEEAERAEQRAHWELNLQTDVVTGLHDKILAAVRRNRAAGAQARLDSAREAWKAALARLVPAFDAIEALRAAHALEAEAGDEYADVRSEWRLGFDDMGLQVRTGPNGRPYVTTPEPTVAITLDGVPILTAGELVARLSAPAMTR